MTDAETVARLRAEARYWRLQAERRKDTWVLVTLGALLLGLLAGAVAASMGGVP